MSKNSKRRLTHIDTEEVSLVDRAANKHRFSLIKRERETVTEDKMSEASSVVLEKEVDETEETEKGGHKDKDKGKYKQEKADHEDKTASAIKLVVPVINETMASLEPGDLKSAMAVVLDYLKGYKEAKKVSEKSEDVEGEKKEVAEKVEPVSESANPEKPHSTEDEKIEKRFASIEKALEEIKKMLGTQAEKVEKFEARRPVSKGGSDYVESATIEKSDDSALFGGFFE